jgi:hypothetical protein
LLDPAVNENKFSTLSAAVETSKFVLVGPDSI